MVYVADVPIGQLAYIIIVYVALYIVTFVCVQCLTVVMDMDMAIQYYITQPPRTEYDNLYILSDCLSAIEIVINRHQTDFSQQIINRVQSFLTTLRGQSNVNMDSRTF